MLQFKSKWNRHSIVYQLTRLILGIIILQTLLLSAILIQGGVIEQAEENSYQLFHDKVSNRKDYVRREMKNNWTNFNPYLSSIRNLMSKSDSDSKAFFQASILELIAMLRTTQATGAFILLAPEKSDQQDIPALYLRDYDPIMNSYSVDDIYMVYGPSELAKSLKIPLDQTWEYDFRVTAENEAFIKRPYESASTANQATLLGYWSKPFKLSENDVSIITYSIPFFDNSGQLRGIIGIDITLNYLSKFFPASELQARDSLGYLIAYSDANDQMVPIIMGGALQKRMIDQNQALIFSSVDSDENIYKIENNNGNETLYASVERFTLYPLNSPFENEQWYLVGMMRGAHLLAAANRIKQILWISLLLAILIGAISGILISYKFTKPIVSLARQVKESAKKFELQFKPTGLLELDELSQSVQSANRRMVESAARLTKTVDLLGLPIGAFEVNYKLGRVFVTDNFGPILMIGKEPEAFSRDCETFLAMLQAIFSFPDREETDVYLIGKGEKRWIRYKKSENAESVIGVVIDVSDEILEKKKIKRERDYDPLTLLLNRKGFQWKFDRWRESSSVKISALVMFDMDDLKRINDTYGHKWGDQYIIAAVEQLRKIAPEDHYLLGRRSGDEFVLLLHGFNEKKDIRHCLDLFYQSLEERPILYPDGQALPVSISAGLMWIESDHLSYDELLHFADEALYVAKRNKKGSYMESQTFS